MSFFIILLYVSTRQVSSSWLVGNKLLTTNQDSDFNSKTCDLANSLIVTIGRVGFIIIIQISESIVEGLVIEGPNHHLHVVITLFHTRADTSSGGFLRQQ